MLHNSVTCWGDRCEGTPIWNFVEGAAPRRPGWRRLRCLILTAAEAVSLFGAADRQRDPVAHSSSARLIQTDMLGRVLAFLVAAYVQGGGMWRGPHNLRKSLPAKETKIGWRDVSKDVLAALPARWA